MRVTVCVPTYRRPKDLARCLAALGAQAHTPDETLITVRPDDEPSAAVARSFPGVTVVRVERGGVVAAMNAALDVATGDVFALTDDDAEPEPEWLKRIVAVFAADARRLVAWEAATCRSAANSRAARRRAPSIGLPSDGQPSHGGRAGANPVDVLKEVRRAPTCIAPLRDIRFDERLRGRGAQVHWELSLCLALERAGWHHCARPCHPGEASPCRPGATTTQQPSRQVRRRTARGCPVYNRETLALEEHPRRRRDWWRFACGVRWWEPAPSHPALRSMYRALLMAEGRAGWERFVATQRARREGRRLADQA